MSRAIFILKVKLEIALKEVFKTELMLSDVAIVINLDI